MDSQYINNLVRDLKLSKKPFDISDVREIYFKDLLKHQREAISKLPIRKVNLNFSKRGLGFFKKTFQDGKHELVIFKVKEDFFLVDNQGYFYARWVLKLINFNT